MAVTHTTRKTSSHPTGGIFSRPWPDNRVSSVTTRSFSTSLLQEEASNHLVPKKNPCPLYLEHDEDFESFGPRRLGQFTNDQPTEYLSEVVATREYTESRPLNEDALRDDQMDEIIYPGSRVLYMHVMPTCEPITMLTSDWDKFMKAFFALFYCHAKLWSVGIRHGDITEDNMMWDLAMEKPKLCDFDLSHSCPLPEGGILKCDSSGLTGLSNTGAWIFIAKDLLTSEAMAGRVKHVYRHEVEALITVLVWITYRYVGGKLRDNPPFENWKHPHYLEVKEKRTQALRAIARGEILLDPPVDLRRVANRTVSKMIMHQGKVEGLVAELEDIAGHRAEFPDDPAPSLSQSLEDWNDLRSLRTKILTTWSIFTQLPSATPFVRLMNEHVTNAPNQEQDSE